MTPVRRLDVQRHQGPTGAWEMVSAPVAPDLRPYVRDLTGFRELGGSTLRRMELPVTGVVLLVNLTRPVRIVDPRLNAPPADHLAFAAGLWDSVVLTETHGCYDGIQVNLTPIGGYRLFGVPMHSLANTVVDLDAVLGAPGRQLVEEIGNAPTWDARFAAIESLVADRIRSARSESRAVHGAWMELDRRAGRVAIDDLARRAGISGKHQIARFREEVGLPPKTVARFRRFEAAARLLVSAPAMPLVEVALRTGFHDQPHLTRDFRRFAGMTPRGFRRIQLQGGWVDASGLD